MNENKMKLKVLIVEDSIGLIKAISMKLEAIGWECIIVNTGEEALKKLNEKPDVVWLDIYLPGISGYEFLKQIRSAKDTMDLPVMVVTNSAGQQMKEEIIKLGILDFFVKAETKLDDIVNSIIKHFEVKGFKND